MIATLNGVFVCPSSPLRFVFSSSPFPHLFLDPSVAPFSFVHFPPHLPVESSSSQSRCLYHIYSTALSFVSACRKSPQLFAGRSYSFPVPSLLYSLYSHLFSVSVSMSPLYRGPRAFPLRCSHSPNSVFSFSYLSGGVSLFYSHDLPAIPVVADRVSLPPACAPVVMLDYLPSALRSLYASPTGGLLLPAPVLPQKTARVYGDVGEYVKLVARMCSLGMMTLVPRSGVKCINGLFGVPKPDGSIRLIVDAQNANRRFVDPPHVNLPTPSHLQQLLHSSTEPLFVSKTDLSNYYYVIAMPQWMQCYFALPGIRVDRLPANLRKLVPWCPAHTLVYPLMLRLSMGFSHAVLIGQRIHECVLYRGPSAPLQQSDSVLSIAHPRISVSVHAVYLDDAILLCTSQSEAIRLHGAVQAAYARAGLPVNAKKLQPPTSAQVAVLGMHINGAARTVSVAVESLMAVIVDTLLLLQRGHATGIEVSRILGKWTWYILVRRPALSLLQHVYKFVQCAGRSRYSIWPSVQRELFALVCIAPLLTSSLRAPFFGQVIATDASMDGGAVVSTPTVLDSNAFSAWWQCAYQPVLHHSVAPVTGNASFHLRSVSIPPTTIFALVYQWQWKFREGNHINELELYSVLSAVKWLLSKPATVGVRLMIMTDNQSVYYGVRKGRSSSSRMLLLLRKLNALLLVSGVTLHVAWVQTAVNPADYGSRHFS